MKTLLLLLTFLVVCNSAHAQTLKAGSVIFLQSGTTTLTLTGSGGELLKNGVPIAGGTGAGTGSVTSVSGSSTVSGLTIGGGPIISAGTLTLSGTPTLSLNSNQLGGVAAASYLTATSTNTVTNKSLANDIEVTYSTGTMAVFNAAASNAQARGDILSTVLYSATNGGVRQINVRGNTYHMNVMANPIVENVTYCWNNSTITITGSAAAPAGGGYSNWLFYADQPATSNWKFLGPLLLDGSSIASKSAIVIQDGSGRVIRDVRARNWGDYGFYLAGGATGTTTNILEACIAEGSGTGFNFVGEYYRATDCLAWANGVGFVIEGGNNKLANCYSSLSGTNVYLKYASNGGHGSWIGGDINHGVTYNLDMDPAFVKGFTFQGVHSYAAPIRIGGEGFSWNGGDIAGNITMSGTATGLAIFDGVRFPQADPSTYLSGLTAGQRAMVKLTNCSTLTGFVADNTIPGDGSGITGLLTTQLTGTLGTVNGVAFTRGGSITVQPTLSSTAITINGTSIALGGSLATFAPGTLMTTSTASGTITGNVSVASAFTALTDGTSVSITVAANGLRTNNSLAITGTAARVLSFSGLYSGAAGTIDISGTATRSITLPSNAWIVTGSSVLNYSGSNITLSSGTSKDLAGWLAVSGSETRWGVSSFP